jgi:hypothetical protein
MGQSPFRLLRPLTSDYAQLPILEGFNWAECLADVDAGQWYLVVFRSIRRESADPLVLKMLDDRAYEEASAATGLFYYFRGDLNLRRECLSFCLWESQARAEAATRQQAHEAAAVRTDELYESFELERWIVNKNPGSSRLEIWPAPSPVDKTWATRLNAVAPQSHEGAWLAL